MTGTVTAYDTASGLDLTCSSISVLRAVPAVAFTGRLPISGMIIPTGSVRAAFCTHDFVDCCVLGDRPTHSPGPHRESDVPTYRTSDVATIHCRWCVDAPVPTVTLGLNKPCVGVCEPLQAPVSGAISYNSTGPLSRGTVATFSCDSGFTVSSNRTSQCVVFAPTVTAIVTNGLQLRFPFNTDATNTGSFSTTIRAYGTPIFRDHNGVASVFFDNILSAYSVTSDKSIFFRASTGLTDRNQWTVATWYSPVWAGAYLQTNYMTILALRDDLTVDDGLNMDLSYNQATGEATIANYIALGPGWWQEVGNAVVTPSNNTWRHVAVTYSGSTFSLYFDAELVSRRDNIYASPGVAHLLAGISGDQVRGYYGHLSDLRVYGRALSEAEISSVRSGMAVSWSAPVPECIGGTAANRAWLTSHAWQTTHNR
jgi:hypothetical protein